MIKGVEDDFDKTRTPFVGHESVKEICRTTLYVVIVIGFTVMGYFHAEETAWTICTVSLIGFFAFIFSRI